MDGGKQREDRVLSLLSRADDIVGCHRHASKLEHGWPLRSRRERGVSAHYSQGESRGEMDED